MSWTNRSAGRRLSVITIDQLISGGSNVLITVLAAHLLSVGGFGYFGIVFLVYTLMIGVYRALISDPMLVHPLEAHERPEDVIGAGCLLALGLAGTVLAAGLGVIAVSAEVGDALIILALCAPLLMLQDLGRYLGFAFQRPAAAIALDVVWLVIMLGAIAVLAVAGTHALPALIAAWAGSGAAAGLLLFVQHRGIRPRLHLSWLRYTWGFSWRYLISYASGQGAALATLTGVGAIAGARARGGLQGTLLVIRPYTTFQLSAVASGVGEISRYGLQGASARRHVTRTTFLTVGVALLTGAVMLLLPDSLGKLLLGATWDATKPLLLPTCALLLAIGLLTGPRIGLLGMRAIQKAVVIDVVSTAVVLATTLGGAVLAGVTGAVWLRAGGQAVMTLVWWLTFWTHTGPDQASPTHRHLDRREPAAVAGSG